MFSIDSSYLDTVSATFVRLLRQFNLHSLFTALFDVTLRVVDKHVLNENIGNVHLRHWLRIYLLCWLRLRNLLTAGKQKPSSPAVLLFKWRMHFSDNIDLVLFGPLPRTPRIYAGPFGVYFVNIYIYIYKSKRERESETEGVKKRDWLRERESFRVFLVYFISVRIGWIIMVVP